MSTRRISIVSMIEGALCIALALVLTRINLFAMPQGGSVDLELVPLILFAYRRGPKLGILVGALTGVMKVLTGGYFLNVIQLILDYPLAYAFAGIAAFYPRILWLILAALGQLTSHVVSGAIFFAKYAPSGWNPWMYSIIYNAPVVIAKYAISAVVAIILWQILQKTMPVRQ
ncbi:MAG: energy-coupled thiamine transporter ThiT [Synergistaceae bacterium]|nr:energy-coupled thiamine transporter ThiT [Synergistaceae bacterium]